MAVDDVRSQQAVYAARVERKFAIKSEAIDDVLRQVADHLPRDPMYPTAQAVSTTYIRSIDEGGPKGKIRIRTYPSSPSAPTFLEFKEAADAMNTKQRIKVVPDIVERLVRGQDVREAVGLIERGGEDLPVARRAVDLVDRGMEPAVRVDYMREAFEDTTGTVRVTIDRDLVQSGVGRLEGHGSAPRPGAILELKTAGEALPSWLDDVLKAGAADITPLASGKGKVALNAVLDGAKLLR
ncbi:MAG: hypothetical protein JWM86_1733 [Thermoleophilia bacterium]|nr:hypothetical protein [Thermoleophilia bacterium]